MGVRAAPGPPHSLFAALHAEQEKRMLAGYVDRWQVTHSPVIALSTISACASINGIRVPKFFAAICNGGACLCRVY